ncbi:hypothetical protein EDB80DRAFT_594256 [Ilyonectria destructans]|nr:hypothetical protein EDB80DRAFT_594256 [Ilyonectria destructans]
MDDKVSSCNHLQGWIWFVTGPTASRKTTVAKSLLKSLNFTYIKGDDISLGFPKIFAITSKVQLANTTSSFIYKPTLIK